MYKKKIYDCITMYDENLLVNSRFEILRLKSRDIKDTHGRTRYYSKEHFCEKYYLTSQWIESQWNLYEKWLKSIGYNDKDY